jgi:hypothetical protein
MEDGQPGAKRAREISAQPKETLTERAILISGSPRVHRDNNSTV